MPKRALTAAAVERLKPPAEGQVEHFDAGFPGLALRISYGGGRSWVYFYRTHGKQRRITLGTYPALSLADAREAWRMARAAVERGEDPAAAKVEAKRREPDTVRRVGEDFIARYAKPRNRTADEVARMFAQHLYPTLGHRRIETVTRRDVLDLLDGIEARTSGARANRVLANVRRLFGWAVERGILEDLAGREREGAGAGDGAGPGAVRRRAPRLPQGLRRNGRAVRTALPLAPPDRAAARGSRGDAVG